MRGYTGNGLYSTLSLTEKAAWNAVKSKCTNFLGNYKAENCREIFSEICLQFMKCSV